MAKTELENFLDSFKPPFKLTTNGLYNTPDCVDANNKSLIGITGSVIASVLAKALNEYVENHK